MLFDLYNLHFVLGYVHLFLALILNSFLIYLIKYETVSALGSYRHLLTLMSVYEINYSVAFAITSPTVPGIIFTSSVMLFLVALWGGVCWVFFNPTPERSARVAELAETVFHLNIYEMAYSLIEYKQPSNNWDVIGVSGMIIVACNCVFCFSCIIACGLLTSRAFSQLQHMFTKKVRDIQGQLFRSLIVMSLVPVLTIYLPCLVIFYGPFFGIGVYQYGIWMQILGSINPVVDPIVVMYFIGDYRKATSRIVRRHLLRQNIIWPEGTNATNGPTATASTGRHLAPHAQ